MAGRSTRSHPEQKKDEALAAALCAGVVRLNKRHFVAIVGNMTYGLITTGTPSIL
jgi:hypothetical protein